MYLSFMCTLVSSLTHFNDAHSKLEKVEVDTSSVARFSKLVGAIWAKFLGLFHKF